MDNNNRNNYDDFFKEEGNSNSSANDQQRESNKNADSNYNSYNQQAPQGQPQQTVYGQQPGAYNQHDANRVQAPHVQDAQYTTINDASSSTEPASQKTQDEAMYYYTYGNVRTSNQDQPTNDHYGQQALYGNQPPSAPTAPVYNEQTNTQQTYRPFTTSQGGGNDPFAPKRDKKQSNGIGKMFLSFMVGVIAVGLLMYTADVQNWFSQNTITTSQSASTNIGSGQTSKGTTTENGSTASNTLMKDRPDNISGLFTSASPAVVKIETYSKASSNSGSSSLLDDPFFRQFFGDSIPKSNKQDSGSSSELRETGMGTGFFFDSTGYILTNQHVIANSDEIHVVVEGYDKPFVAKLLGSSYDLDLAVLKIEGDQQFPTLALGSSDDTQIGDWVVAIGNPYGFDHTLTVGVISAKERPIDISDSEGTRNYKNLLQTDASINPGNSGGPLLNMNGEVIGINTAVSSTAQGIGFAIPTSTISGVLDALKNDESLPVEAAPFIGAELQDLTEDIATQLGLSSTDGTIVRSVYYNSPAYVGELKQFDVIIGVDDKTIKSTNELVTYIKSQTVGTTIQLKINRDGKEMTLPVTIGDKNEFGLQ